MPPDELAPDELEDVARLDDDHEEEEELAARRVVAVDVEKHQRRRVAHAVDTRHQAPLDRRGALEEAFRLAGKDDARGEEEEDVDGNQDAEEAVPVDTD